MEKFGSFDEFYVHPSPTWSEFIRIREEIREDHMDLGFIGRDYTRRSIICQKK